MEDAAPGYVRYHNASGNVPPFRSGEKDPFPKIGSEGNIGDLQRALNKLGATPPLIDDGIFGDKTKDAIKDLGYSYNIFTGLSSDTFYKILSDANKGDADNATVSESEMKALWAKDKAKYGKLSSEPDYDKWVKRQKTLTGIKDFGKGLFTVAVDWFKQKQAGSPTGEEYTPSGPADTSRIWGVPAPVVYIGGALAGGLVIWGIIALATKKPQQVVVRQVTPAM